MTMNPPPPGEILPEGQSPFAVPQSQPGQPAGAAPGEAPIPPMPQPGYSGSPAAVPPPTGKKKPGIGGIVTGSILLVMAIIVAPLVALALVGSQAVGLTESVQSFDSGERVAVTFSSDADQVLYSDAGRMGESYVLDADGDEVTLRDSDMDEATTLNGVRWTPIGIFTPVKDEVYEIGCTAPAGFKCAIGPSFAETAKGVLIGTLVPIGIGILCFIAGLILLITSLVRRSRWKKANAAPVGYGGYPGTPIGVPMSGMPAQPGVPMSGMPAQPGVPMSGMPAQPGVPMSGMPAQPGVPMSGMPAQPGVPGEPGASGSDMPNPPGPGYGTPQ